MTRVMSDPYAELVAARRLPISAESLDREHAAFQRLVADLGDARARELAAIRPRRRRSGTCSSSTR